MEDAVFMLEIESVKTERGGGCLTFIVHPKIPVVGSLLVAPLFCEMNCNMTQMDNPYHMGLSRLLPYISVFPISIMEFPARDHTVCILVEIS